MRVVVLASQLQVESNPDAPGVVATATGAGIALFCTVFFWWVFGHAVTLAHETSHGIVASLLGGDVTGLRINNDHTGVTGAGAPSGTSGWGSLDFAVIAGAGYLGPPVFGLLAAETLGHGRPLAVLWGTVVVLAVVLPSSRSLFTFFTIVTLGAIFVIIAVNGDDRFQLLSAVTWAWMLIGGGLMQLFTYFDRSDDLTKMSPRLLGPMFLALLYTAVILLVAYRAGMVLVGAQDPFP